jgi:nitrous oxidase accessory protein NosD
MRISRWISGLLLAVLFAMPALAADVTGKWKGPMQSGGDANFDLKSEKDVVIGNMIGYDGKPYAISDGKLDGENLSMKVAFEWQGQPVTLIVTGKVAGEQMDVHIATDNGYWSTDATLKKEK